MNKKSKTSLFLMEIIISVMLFSIICAVCSQLFVKTRMQSIAASALLFAHTQSQTCAELFYSADAEGITQTADLLLQFYPTLSEKDETHFIQYYNEDFVPLVSETSATYAMYLSLSKDGDFLLLDNSFQKIEDQSVIYQLVNKKYLPTTSPILAAKEAK